MKFCDDFSSGLSSKYKFWASANSAVLCQNFSVRTVRLSISKIKIKKPFLKEKIGLSAIRRCFYLIHWNTLKMCVEIKYALCERFKICCFDMQRVWVKGTFNVPFGASVRWPVTPVWARLLTTDYRLHTTRPSTVTLVVVDVSGYCRCSPLIAHCNFFTILLNTHGCTYFVVT